MKKNITEIKRNLVERLFAVLHRDYNECTIYTPGIENIVPGANAITIKRLENYDYKTNKTSLRYKLHVVTINDANHYDWETTVAKFDSLDPDTREKLERFISAKCDNAPVQDMPTTFVGHAYYFTLEGGEKENTNNKNNKAMKVYDEITLSNRNFEFWGSAKENAESLTNGQLETVQAILEDLYPEGISAVQLNDIFRFDFDQIREWLGIEPEE